jgi:hypothetical protein
VTVPSTVLSVSLGRRAWSLAAFALAVLGFAASVWVIFGSDGDPSQARWPLVVAPLVLTFAPLLVPRQGVRIAAAVLLGLWCALTGFSIGLMLLPALGAAFMASVREPE